MFCREAQALSSSNLEVESPLQFQLKTVILCFGVWAREGSLNAGFIGGTEGQEGMLLQRSGKSSMVHNRPLYHAVPSC